jgi:hypothetical protein
MPNPSDADLPNPSSYTIDAANGVVTDNVTGLMWQRDVAPKTYTWKLAKQYCANLSLGGQTDWRLPVRIELVSLVDFMKPQPGPTIDTVAFPNTPGDLFWTSSPMVGVPSNAWFVNFYYGHTFTNGAAAMGQVRCVR